MRIERTLFWFKDGDLELQELNQRFFGYGIFLNRLLNEKYSGQKIKFINIDLATEETYALYPSLPKQSFYYYGGHLRCYAIFNYKEFSKKQFEDQIREVWSIAYKYLSLSAKELKNEELLTAVDHAYNQGYELAFNPNFRVLEKEIIMDGEEFKASVWIEFDIDKMTSKFTLERDNKIVFTKNIDSTQNGVEFFLEIYKQIEFKNNTIIISGHREINYLPLRIPISGDLILK